MRRVAFIATVGATLAAAGTAVGMPERTDAPSPQAAIFYYTWYGTPDADGSWLHWGQGRHTPPQAIGSSYYPSRGPYSSSLTSVVRAQMREIAATGIDTVVVSWWGPGSYEDERLRPVAAAARAAGLRVALHVEPWNGRTPADVVDAVRRLRGLGIRDVYVYDSTVDSDDAWRTALSGLTGLRVFAHTPLPGKALKGGSRACTPTTSLSTTALRSGGCARARAGWGWRARLPWARGSTRPVRPASRASEAARTAAGTTTCGRQRSRPRPTS